MIKNLIFDLDDTLYPHSSPMGKGIFNRIVSYSANFFGKTFEEILELRKTELKKHVSTLAWMKYYGFDREEEYFASVHPASEVSELEFDSNLRSYLESIKLPKVILTNAPSEHAEHVLEFFKIRDLFHPVISDIRRNKYKGKPAEFSYRDALNLIGGTVEDTLFMDDWPGYVEGFVKLGGKGVIVGEEKYEVPEEFKGRIFRIKSIYELKELLEKGI